MLAATIFVPEYFRIRSRHAYISRDLHNAVRCILTHLDFMVEALVPI